MSATVSLLSSDRAIAMRLVRTQFAPYDFWLWLSGLSSTPTDNIRVWIDSGVCNSIKAITAPNLADVDARERLNLTEIEAWIAAITGFVHKRSSELKLSCGHPLLATALLPLYRSLATRNLPEALQQTRSRLSEMLALVGIAQELGEEFPQLLERRGAPVTSPYLILKSVLKIDLVSVGGLGRQLARNLEAGADPMNSTLATASETLNPPNARELPWSEPQLLWQIAGELIAKKADIVLPRPWADVSVPWTAISDHWNALTHRLNIANLPSVPSDVEADVESIDDQQGEVTEYNEDDEIVSEMIDDLLAMQCDVAEVKIADQPTDIDRGVASDDTSSAPNNTSNSAITGRAHASHGSSVGAPRMEADSDEEPDSDAKYPETDSLESENLKSVPKIAIIEIASHSDKVFVNLIRRQIATARNDDRTVCLIAVCVESDDDTAQSLRALTRTNGLAIWQEQLVNWLADHPQVHDPLAFVTTNGQLVVSILDAERSEATNIVREGLLTVLADKRPVDEGSLSRVPIPAKYFSGIGSVTAPNANFVPEQLIEATWRCLSAAQSQGKATIKSIEVF